MKMFIKFLEGRTADEMYLCIKFKNEIKKSNLQFQAEQWFLLGWPKVIPGRRQFESYDAASSNEFLRTIKR